MNFMEDMQTLAEEMDEKEREVFLAMAEQIDREENEFELRKIIYLSDYRERLGKKETSLRRSDLVFDKTR